MTFGFFADAGLSIPLGASTRHLSTQGDRLIYFGSPAAGKQLQDATNPGVTNLQIVVTDSAGGSGLAAAAIKLAATNGGLAGATGGTALAIGHTVLSGAGNAKPVHIRIDASAGTVGTTYTDLGLDVPNTAETDV
ncbi:hypothetical protein [Methyloversatilis sp. XJ19-49]|uniref:hypothetical protein n=1 Tax=Methyloversatilis sp. XJ19-49 TaxID=2963429 RepID=UPI00211C68BC|nr:hypothetical protein [Methyloversatilis sp. XJ19-49]MCQ9378794.1 hypothetical protein [Methyloversatilis sp. XJ19-49]